MTQVFVVFAFIYLILNGIITALRERNHTALLAGYKAALERKDVRDAAEDAYKRASVTVQDAIRMFHSIVKVIGNLNLPVLDDYLEEGGEFLEDVTDGEPNA